MPHLPTGKVTFLFTDIEGSTRRWEAHPATMGEALARHDSLLTSTLQAHNGTIFKSIGDSFCAVFASAGDALLAAVAIQRAMLREDWSSVGSLELRIALHTGEAELRDHDYFGPPLNHIARLLSAGYGAQILVSQATELLVRDALPEGLSLRDLGEHRLRDLLHPMRIFQLLASDLRSDFLPIKSLDTRSTNLPIQATPLVGRDEQVEELSALLRSPGLQLLTLAGPGGIGKTRLSLRVASKLVDEYEHGVYFVPLSALTDASLVLGSIAHVLGVVESGRLSLIDALSAFLCEKQLLLVLDNFEQVLAAAGIAARLMESAPRLTLLVTSRALLDIPGERAYYVPPLAVPSLEQLPPLETLGACESVQLFVERAQTIQPDFVLSQENAPAIAEICARLEGLPLAIELAAARIKIFSPDDLVRRLSSRLKLLTGGARDLPARQQTIRGAIDWSYNLLAPEEQTLFRRLGVFVRGWTLDAAEQVCAEPESADGLEEQLRSLQHKSLILSQGAGSDQRYSMLELLREYAIERLVAEHELEALQLRHTQYYLELVERIEGESGGPGQLAWLEQLEQEHDNLRAVLGRALERQEATPALRIGGAIWKFWNIHCHFSEARHWLEAALALPGNQEPDYRQARLKALWGGGWGAFTLSDMQLAGDFFEEGVELAGQLSQKRLLGMTLHGVAAIARVRGNYQQATEMFEQSLPLFYGVGDREHVAWTLLHLSMPALEQHDYERAVPKLRESLALFRELEQRWPAAETLAHLGYALFGQGDFGQARDLLEQALVSYQELGDKAGVAKVRAYLGPIALEQGDLVTARALYQDSLTRYRELEDLLGASVVLELIGALALRQGDPLGALKLWGAVEHLRELIEVPFSVAERAKFDARIAVLRELLDAQIFQSVWQEGQALSWQDAVRLALERVAN